jgi:ABC-2 type transport system permease protein
VQQNVPAWALFGMFFIVVPLSTSVIRERREGIVDRLQTMPVSLLVILLGKLTAYTCVCMVQFLCIVMVGKWVLPLMGTDVLVLGDKLPAVALIALCSSLAATGYGILLGALARTQEQATVVGPVTVVIAAVLGGIMVPVFAMPQMIQTLSLGSPLAWGHSAFMIVLVRGGSWPAVSGRMGLLLLFFILSLLIGGLAISRRH